jgi:quercetin dioxygenase-like cupin family protein
MRTTVGLVGALAFATMGHVAAQEPAAKQPAAGQPGKHVMMSADELKWGAGPPSLPPGAQMAVLSGDPAKTGLFVLRAKLPDGYHVPPHSHPTDEHVTVVSGTLMAALGNTLDESALHAINAGGYANMPARTNHYVRAKGETIIQVTAMGPFDVAYVNASDDPRKKSKPKE